MRLISGIHLYPGHPPLEVVGRPSRELAI